jgi:hypothetical protein
MWIMKNILSVLLVASLLSCATVQWMAGEKEDFSELIYSSLPSGHLDFEKDPKFSAIMDELKYWIVHTRYDNEGNEIDKLDDWNHFCAVGYIFPPNVDGDERFYIEKELVVYWIEKGMFKRWYGSTPLIVPASDYRYSSSLMDSEGFLMADTFPLEELDKTVPLDTSREIMEHAENVVGDCVQHGKMYTIGPFTPLFEED